MSTSGAAGRPLYRPYRWAAADFQLGLRPMLPETWILIGPEHADMMQQKCARLDRYPEFYYGSLPDSLPAQRELRERVTAHLLADHPQCFEKHGSRVVSRVTNRGIDLNGDAKEPLLQLSYLVEEDFMLLDQARGSIRITAASNAYSSSGRLVAAVGHGMAWAHERVPQLTAKLGSRIERVLNSIHVNAPTERFTWQVTPLATVFFPHDDPHAANAAAMHEVLGELRRDPARAGDLLWMRAERQTLRRLPDTNAVAFSLHTYSDPLSCLEHDAASIRAILALLEGYSEERWQYSEMDIVREPLIAWLEAAANKCY